MDDLKYIKKFSKINITEVCRKAKVSRENVLNGRASKKTTLKVRKQIENEIAKLYLIESDENGEK